MAMAHVALDVLPPPPLPCFQAAAVRPSARRPRAPGLVAAAAAAGPEPDGGDRHGGGDQEGAATSSSGGGGGGDGGDDGAPLLGAIGGDVAALADYVGALAARRAADGFEAERRALAARLGEAEARCERQGLELEALRQLLGDAAAAAAVASSAAAGASSNTTTTTSSTSAGLAKSSDRAAAAAAAVMRQTDALRQEAGAWRGAYQLEAKARAASDGAMRELLGVLDELMVRCGAIGAKLAEAEAASAAAVRQQQQQQQAAHRWRWRGGGGDGSGRGGAWVVDAALVVLAMGCAVAITIVVCRQVLIV